MSSHLLVVDDSAVDRLLAGRLLATNSQWNVAYATNGKDALEQIQSRVPDLVVTDLQMPQMNGLELVQRLRELHPQIPVLLMTAYGSEEIAREAIERGASSYVPKHELCANLVETVTRLLMTAAREQVGHRLRIADSEFDREFDNDLPRLSAFTQELRQTISDRGLLDENDCLRFATAVDEALTNAYFHGNLEIDSKLRELDTGAYHDLANRRRGEVPYRDRHIRVQARITTDQVSVTIRDDGPGFDQSQLPDPTDPEYLDRPFGRGLLLMRAFSDAVNFNDLGNEVTLVKKTE